MSKTKKAGCTNYAEVSDDYMLYNKAITTKGGNRKKRGGDDSTFFGQALETAKGMLQTPTSTSTQQSTPSKGGCGSCSKKRGGAVELAPFAAALAFLATRFATDKNFNLPKSLPKSLSKPLSKTSSKSKSTTRKTTKKSV